MSRARTVRVALAGCGVVGASLVRLCAESEAGLAAQGLRFEWTRVLVRDLERPRPVELPRQRFTTQVEELLAADAELVVEAMGGIEPALTLARHTLAAGRRFVTANKALIAAHGAELLALARRSGGRLDFEAAVGGGVPVIRVLRDSLARTDIREVRGVLNGTSNYILTRLSEGARFEEALEDARAAGFAEADPSRDLDGRDIADKITLVAWLAFGIPPHRVRLHRRGIVPDPERLVQAAAAFNRVVRLVGACRLGEDGKVSAAVEPVAVPADSELGRIRNEINWVQVETKWSGTIQLAGPGAGGEPTASAVLADMIRPAGDMAASEATPAPGADESQHRWLVAASRGQTPAVRYGLESKGVALEARRDLGDGTVLLRFAPVERGAVEALLERWPEAERPLLLRWEAGARERAPREEAPTSLRSAWL